MTSHARKLGNIGEKALQTMCAESEIVATRTDEDRLGWDYFLEIPSLSTQYQPPDKPCPWLRCLVQVKATTAHKSRVRVKATALKPLIDADCPAFIVLFELNNDKPHRCYLQHVDKDIIQRTLKRLRHSGASSAKQRPNVGDLTIAFGRSQQLDITGDALARALWSYVQQGIPNYINEKDHYRQWVGYDSIPLDFSIQSSRSPIIELIEHDLGIVDQLHVPRMSLRDRRFEIEAEQPLAQFKEGKMTFQAHTPLVNNQAAFTFAVDPQDHTLNFVAEHRASLFNSWAPPKDQRFRLRGGWFDSLVRPFSETLEERIEPGGPVISGKGVIHIIQHIEPDKVYTSNFLLNLVRASHILATLESIHFIVWPNSSRTNPLESTLTGNLGLPRMDDELHLLESLSNILRAGKIDFSTCSLSLDDLYSQAGEISFFGSIATNSLRGTPVNWKCSPREEESRKTPTKLNTGAWLNIGLVRFQNCDLIVVANLTLTNIILDFAGKKSSAEVSETQLMLVMPLMGQSLPKRNLRKQIDSYLAGVRPDFFIETFRPSTDNLRGDSSEFEQTLF